MAESKPESTSFTNQGWAAKFRFAIGGLWLGFKGPSDSMGQNSFLCHIPCSIVVLATGIWLRVGWISMAVLLLCIGFVFVAELLNTSIEALSRAVSREHDRNIGAALDIAAGAVLMASLTAVIVGAMVFAPHLIALAGI
jgi:diacylglycerol kinase (ATP)